MSWVVIQRALAQRRRMSHGFLPDDLIMEVLSFLDVKSLMRCKSVNKLWNTLISDPIFVKLHLKHSPKTKHMAQPFRSGFGAHHVATFPLNKLIKNPSMTISRTPYDRWEIRECDQIIGSCNGLLCLYGHSSKVEDKIIWWFRIWNPTTNTISKRLGYRTCKHKHTRTYAFGYDDSTTTYKVVVLSPIHVKILNLGDNSWRKISSFPEHVVIPSNNRLNHGVYLKGGTINWFAIRSNLSDFDWLECRDNITVDQLVIISLDLGTETYMQLSPPHGVNEVPYDEPIIVVLMDCLCFSHNDVKGTHFVIWIMTEFGVEQSWTQFFKISFQNLQVDIKFRDRGRKSYQLFPFCLSENGHTLILANSAGSKAIFYNLRDNRVEKTCERTRYSQMRWFYAKDYVESLVSIC